MGLAAPWYRRGGTSVESLIPYSYGRRTLVVKGAEEVENAKANSKYQDRVEGQRPRNFIRPVSMDFSSRELKAMDFVLMQECSTKERSRQYAVGTIPFLLRGVGDKGDKEDGTIPETTRTIKDLLQVGGLQVGVNFLLFSGKISCIPEVQWQWEGESQWLTQRKECKHF
ncbi:hypothetical protein GW17_00025718 [Ensete ventricosum]|nr:hypothetical protein GW17_00025718 [Ensete ventricosum]